ncbi:hypothetical protein FRC06_009207, partial [Ceratobasidium sp. 370]
MSRNVQQNPEICGRTVLESMRCETLAVDFIYRLLVAARSGLDAARDQSQAVTPRGPVSQGHLRDVEADSSAQTPFFTAYGPTCLRRPRRGAPAQHPHRRMWSHMQNPQ